MKKKLNLELEALAVDSFETSAASDGHGTVHGQAALAPQPTPPEYADCTCAYSCLCRTAYYYCGTGPHSIYSCDFTYNGSCKVTNAGYSCELPCTG
jgi:hypothetical protein